MEQSTYKEQYEAKNIMGNKENNSVFNKSFKTLQGKIIFFSWINNAIWQGHLKVEIEL